MNVLWSVRVCAAKAIQQPTPESKTRLEFRILRHMKSLGASTNSVTITKT